MRNSQDNNSIGDKEAQNLKKSPSHRLYVSNSLNYDIFSKN